MESKTCFHFIVGIIIYLKVEYEVTLCFRHYQESSILAKHKEYLS